MFQCHSPKSSHPLPLPQSPKDCGLLLRVLTGVGDFPAVSEQMMEAGPQSWRLHPELKPLTKPFVTNNPSFPRVW